MGQRERTVIFCGSFESAQHQCPIPLLTGYKEGRSLDILSRPSMRLMMLHLPGFGTSWRLPVRKDAVKMSAGRRAKVAVGSGPAV
jgi:hypothetical protein